MNQKRVFPLTLALVVLVAIAWSLGLFDDSASTLDTPSVEFSAESATSITIRKGSDELVASKDAELGWHLESPVVGPVDSNISRTLLTQLEDLEVESVVSSQPDRYPTFQVDSTQATYMRIEGEEPIEMWIGKTGPDFQSRYIRFGGDDRVYLAQSVPSNAPDVDRWRDKELWSFPRASIKSITVTRPDESYTLESDPEGWKIVKPAGLSTADSTEVSRYLGRIATVKGDGFLMDLDQAQVSDSIDHSVEVTLTNGESAKLEIHERSEDAAGLVSGSGRSHETGDVVKLLSYRVRSLAPNSSELLPDDED
jgi:hypothetical protein